MKYQNILAKHIVDAAFKVHYRLGPGLYESVYETLLAYELSKKSILVQCQHPLPVIYDESIFNEGFRADMVVDNQVIVELKSVEKVTPSHKKQLLTYLRISDLRLGLLVNFGEAKIKDGITRIVNGL